VAAEVHPAMRLVEGLEDGQPQPIGTLLISGAKNVRYFGKPRAFVIFVRLGFGGPVTEPPLVTGRHVAIEYGKLPEPHEVICDQARILEAGAGLRIYGPAPGEDINWVTINQELSRLLGRENWSLSLTIVLQHFVRNLMSALEETYCETWEYTDLKHYFACVYQLTQALFARAHPDNPHRLYFSYRAVIMAMMLQWTKRRALTETELRLQEALTEALSVRTWKKLPR
jgi:hypothetical protein